MMLKDPLDLCVQEAVGKGDCQALSGEKHRPQMNKHQVEEGALVGGSDDGDEVGDAEQGDDDK